MRSLVALFVIGFLFVVACTSNAGNSPAPPPPCDQACQDAIALRGLREGIKSAYNIAIAANDAGPQDATRPCVGGSVHVFGTATSNAAQGATFVQLTYVVDHCKVVRVDTDPLQNYSLTLSGTLTEKGTLSQQPTSTTALDIESGSFDIVGTVHNPPVNYTEMGCAFVLTQNGNQFAGTLCGRTAGLTL